MKKMLLFAPLILLALCVALSSAALAENVCACACQPAQDESLPEESLPEEPLPEESAPANRITSKFLLATPTPEPTLTPESTPVVPLEYAFTQELVYGDIHLFLPSTVNKDDPLESYWTDVFGLREVYSGYSPLREPFTITISYSDRVTPDYREIMDAYYSGTEDGILEAHRLAARFSTGLVQADETIGILRDSTSLYPLSWENQPPEAAVLIVSPEQNKTLSFLISAGSTEEVYELLDGILEHIVAPRAVPGPSSEQP